MGNWMRWCVLAAICLVLGDMGLGPPSRRAFAVFMWDRLPTMVTRAGWQRAYDFWGWDGTMVLGSLLVVALALMGLVLLDD
jgi:hypothetical protein